MSHWYLLLSVGVGGDGGHSGVVVVVVVNVMSFSSSSSSKAATMTHDLALGGETVVEAFPVRLTLVLT